MNILVTGAGGFIGRNLTAALENIRDGKDRAHPMLEITNIYKYERNSDLCLLEKYCKHADFVFHLAGVNRPKEISAFSEGNVGFSMTLLNTLKVCENTCPVMLASSIQASLTGRFEGSEYGKSKLAAEELFFQYAKETGSKVLVYRFPNVFGKWCRPGYNSVIATFCHNIAHDLPIKVNDASQKLELLYIDDLIETMLAALEGKEQYCEHKGESLILRADGKYCCAPVTHRVTVGEIAELLYSFRDQSSTLMMPKMADGSFVKNLYSTYLSYLPREKVSYPLRMNIDFRGSFTEILRTADSGQFSVNISKPGITKGQHWHHSKWELFIVVYGHGLIRERNLGNSEILEFEVSGEKMEAVHMLPGYTHSIVNLSETEALVTLMWANESFNPEKPDTFFEEV